VTRCGTRIAGQPTNRLVRRSRPAYARSRGVRPWARKPGREHDQSRIKREFEIAPVHLDLKGKNRALVGLGSYIVNTGGCNDCHTNPSYLPGNDPLQGQPEKINTAGYLAGGQHFGPFVSANITPDATGRPAGLTLEEFMTLMRIGHDPDAPAGSLLQVMPWPVFGKKVDQDLKAIYEYLRSIATE
jgi:hypothetical protein